MLSKTSKITFPALSNAVQEKVQTEIKYEGYIARQNAQINEIKRLEKKLLPKDLVYADIKELRIEAREKLDLVKPENIGRASRISGVSPADISVLLVYLEKQGGNI